MPTAESFLEQLLEIDEFLESRKGEIHFPSCRVIDDANQEHSLLIDLNHGIAIACDFDQFFVFGYFAKFIFCCHLLSFVVILKFCCHLLSLTNYLKCSLTKEREFYHLSSVR